MLQNPAIAFTGAVGQWFENAVLVYGPRKSGTTLLQNLLDSGEEMFVYPAELKLKYIVSADSAGGDVGNLYVRHSRITAVDVPRFNKARYQTLLDAVERQPPHDLKALIRADLGMVIQGRTDQIHAVPSSWCAKEVGGETKAILRWWFDNFQAPRAVLIFRDPKMIVRSILNDRRRNGRPQSLRRILYEIVDSLRVVKAQESFIGCPGVVAVTYEDLVEDTERTMSRLAEFLSIRFGAHLTVPTIFSQSVVVLTASKPKKRVFNDGAKWSDGLTLRERIAVRVFSSLAWFNPNLRVKHSTLRRRIASSQP